MGLVGIRLPTPRTDRFVPHFFIHSSFRSLCPATVPQYLAEEPEEVQTFSGSKVLLGIIRAIESSLVP